MTKNPTSFYRYLFVVAIGFLFVGVLFTILGWPAAELFSILGGVASSVLYVLFTLASSNKKGSFYPRHVTFGSLILGQILKSFGQGLGNLFLFLALIAVLVWLIWSVLEELPPSEE